MLLKTLKEKYQPEKLVMLPESKKQWFKDARFGMFIHWGLYSITGRGEWVMMNERINKEEYAKLAKEFTGEQMDFKKLAHLAKESGMKYMVLTSRHHDGFSLFDTKVGDYNSVQFQGRDYVREFTDACREEGLGVGIYYSPMDWRYEGYFFPEMYLDSAMKMKEQCEKQLMELMSNYGKIDILWFDGQWLAHGGLKFKPEGWYREKEFRKDPIFYDVNYFWESERVLNQIRKLQPDIMINNRFGCEGDFTIRERTIGELTTDRVWESCDCIADSWGYMPNRRMYSLRELIHNLVSIIVRDGNYLLNVGPDGSGLVEERQKERLRQLGKWLSMNGESIYGTTGGPLPAASWGGVCYRGRDIYVHILEWTEDVIRLPLAMRVVSGELLNGKQLQYTQTKDQVAIEVPIDDRDSYDTIIKLRANEEVAGQRTETMETDDYGLGDGLQYK